jgi:type III restriction enzyme
MFELKPFQAESAKLMADRYAFYRTHPDRPTTQGNAPRPFYQALSALTGAGKTPILAQAVALMRAQFGSEPIVFWMSKARSVVGQTYLNFSAGGKYSQIIEGFRVIRVSGLTPELISDGSAPLLILATTGLFNNKDQSEGALNIYKKDADLWGVNSPWERLIERKDGIVRRPLLIVYDESHNLSEQQSQLLAELKPEAYLLASATPNLPSHFKRTVLQHISGWVEEALSAPEFKQLLATSESGVASADLFCTTSVENEKVVEAELVKSALHFDGTTAPMEQCLDELLARMGSLKAEIKSLSLDIKPKAIYVCKTNINDDGEKDDPASPFAQREAPPIRIWRFLVEDKGVSPKDIAIYADLKFSASSKPDEVNLFSRGESNFEEFQAGDYHHIIFNLSLQEGWDDPACYLAYIDKSMGSSLQVEQLIGRVLRQYGAEYYENPLLNSAHFFLRVDKESVFADAITSVKAKLKSQGVPIEITSNFGTGLAGVEDLQPKPGQEIVLHHIHVQSEAAIQRINDLLSLFPTYTPNSADTVGEAQSASQIVPLVGDEEEKTIEWHSAGYTNPVRLRWLVNTAIKARSSRALTVTDLQSPKFDIRVQLRSNAEKAAEKLAGEIVEAYFRYSELEYESSNPFQFGTLRVSNNGHSFSNGVYEKYSGFNKLEKSFADALDKTGNKWHRNPSRGGFQIPLLSEGNTTSFSPDYIVWKGKGKPVYCIDTKGGHLLTDAVARKLFDIKDEKGRPKLCVRFISEGKQTELRGKATKGGFTVWKMNPSTGPTPSFSPDLAKAIADCLR